MTSSGRGVQKSRGRGVGRRGVEEVDVEGSRVYVEGRADVEGSRRRPLRYEQMRPPGMGVEGSRGKRRGVEG